MPLASLPRLRGRLVGSAVLIVSLLLSGEIARAVPSPVAWWPAEGNADDVVGPHDGTMLNGATFTPCGRVGQAFMLDGQDDVIRLPDNSIIYSGNHPFTVAFWARVVWMPAGDFDFVMRLHQDEGQFIIVLLNNPGFGTLATGFRGHTGWAVEVDPALFQDWAHVAIGYTGGDKNSGTSYVFFVNGTQVVSYVQHGTIGGTCNNDNTIGADNHLYCPAENRFLEGLLDEVQVFDHALSLSEVQEFYAAAGPLPCQDPGLAGSVSGRVVADCPAVDTPLLGVHVDAFEVGSGELVGSAVTNASGSYLIESLPAGQYTITVVTPLGYMTPSGETPVTVFGGQAASADFELHCIAITANPRTIGFWKHQVGVATGGTGRAQLDAMTLCSHLDMIAAHFNGNEINEVIVYQPPLSGACSDKLQVAKQLLNLPGSVAMIDRAKQHLMSLLLNVAAGYISQTEIISADGATVSQAITYCDNQIDNPTGGHERAKTMGDLINSGQQVPAGLIPLSTRVIAYGQHPAPREPFPGRLGFGLIAPNPAMLDATITFELPSNAPASLEVVDLAGRIVSRREVGGWGAGRHTIRLADPGRLRPGVYLVRLSQEGKAGICRVAVIQ